MFYIGLGMTSKQISCFLVLPWPGCLSSKAKPHVATNVRRVCLHFSVLMTTLDEPVGVNGVKKNEK
jgi:hypothetical protein